jgi:hypothetical protein
MLLRLAVNIAPQLGSLRLADSASLSGCLKGSRSSQLQLPITYIDPLLELEANSFEMGDLSTPFCEHGPDE